MRTARRVDTVSPISPHSQGLTLRLHVEKSAVPTSGSSLTFGGTHGGNERLRGWVMEAFQQQRSKESVINAHRYKSG